MSKAAEPITPCGGAKEVEHQIAAVFPGADIIIHQDPARRRTPAENICPEQQ